MTVAAASAWVAVAASTVTASAMPSEWLRPRQPLVATPRTGSLAWTVKPPSRAVRRFAMSATTPTRHCAPGARCSAMSPPLFT